MIIIMLIIPIIYFKKINLEILFKIIYFSAKYNIIINNYY